MVRLLGRGSGTVLGGRVGLALTPRLLSNATRGREVLIVSGTNGKTTTSAFIATALRATRRAVAINSTGSNMPAGHVAAIAQGPRHAPIVLEVDEAYVPEVIENCQPAVIVLLNLSRDQLDRSNEVRKTVARWHAGLDSALGVVLANADDPLVTAAAFDHPRTVWVAAGSSWRLDATACPNCGRSIHYEDDGVKWSCTCGLRRPEPSWRLQERSEASVLEGPGGSRQAMSLSLPGRFNERNALMAIAASTQQGGTPQQALAAIARVDRVAGRFSTPLVDGRRVRALLAKNPAGWAEMIELVEGGTGPLVVAINARVADGRDPSWLWDVPFERLAGRRVIAAGDRCLDLAVRLHYAGVDHVVRRIIRDALSEARTHATASHGVTSTTDFVGNYTAFNDLLRIT